MLLEKLYYYTSCKDQKSIFLMPIYDLGKPKYLELFYTRISCVIVSFSVERF